ncbi:PUA-like domain-containing protein [Massariosphaeria phaeospora]|uniref:PUA-like domain-containing protein n=1 Tax=Massariosphaeria phaeospora TaxID=100035 RepID=A0A7C8I422_9PLEO|nr:PUA-like domain-containing protein [Massariosphaeria phaeospora]
MDPRRSQLPPPPGLVRQMENDAQWLKENGFGTPEDGFRRVLNGYKPPVQEQPRMGRNGEASRSRLEPGQIPAQQSQRSAPKTTTSANAFGSSHTNTFGSSHKQAATQEDSLFIPDTRQTGIPPNPAWHEDINLSDRAMKDAMKDLNKGSLNQAKQKLLSLKDCIDRCEKDYKGRVPAPELIKKLREDVHIAEVQLTVNKYLCRKTRIFDNGLARIFAGQYRVKYPWDLQEDSRQLYTRWAAQIFEVDLLRGIITGKEKDRNADRIDPNWPKESCKYYGQGNLVIGQWWPTQLCTVRDGAHGAAQGGIYGEKDKGAYSVVISGNVYDDVDNGNEVWYSGTESKDNKPTGATERLFETCTTIKQPVRVIRSCRGDKKNPYHPEMGLRYDGLYDVVEFRCVKPETALYKFRLVRQQKQFPIRYEDNEARRPTAQEIDAYLKLRERGCA